ncbi:Plasminogen [Lamellibrachia satsuma]|nr:Plasminogen [Lamellibrachia satsuma]
MSGIKCTFPFKAFGKIYNKCTTDYVTVKAPWCSLTYDYNKDRKMGYCDFSMKFPLECLQTSRGFDYKGYQRRTVSGRTCQAWAAQQPHGHMQCKPRNRGNYCTNMADLEPTCNQTKPWCYTTDPNLRWEVCDIPKCGGVDRSPKQGVLTSCMRQHARSSSSIAAAEVTTDTNTPEDGPRSTEDDPSISCYLRCRFRLKRH